MPSRQEGGAEIRGLQIVRSEIPRTKNQLHQTFLALSQATPTNSTQVSHSDSNSDSNVPPVKRRRCAKSTPRSTPQVDDLPAKDNKGPSQIKATLTSRDGSRHENTLSGSGAARKPTNLAFTEAAQSWLENPVTQKLEQKYFRWKADGEPHDEYCIVCIELCSELACITCCRVYHSRCLSSYLTKYARSNDPFSCPLCRKRTWSKVPPSVKPNTEKRIFTIATHLKHNQKYRAMDWTQWPDDGELANDQKLLHQMGATVLEDVEEAVEVTSPQIKAEAAEEKPDIEAIDLESENDASLDIKTTVQEPEQETIEVERAEKEILMQSTLAAQKPEQEAIEVNNRMNSANAGSTTLLQKPDWIRCVCEEPTEGHGVMICCDGCTAWQHLACMGYQDEHNPAKYYCERCRPYDHQVLLVDRGGQHWANQGGWWTFPQEPLELILKDVDTDREDADYTPYFPHQEPRPRKRKAKGAREPTRCSKPLSAKLREAAVDPKHPSRSSAEDSVSTDGVLRGDQAGSCAASC